MYQSFYPGSWFIANPGKAPLLLTYSDPQHPFPYLHPQGAAAVLPAVNFHQPLQHQMQFDSMRRMPLNLLMEPVSGYATQAAFLGKRNLGRHYSSKESLTEGATLADSGISSSRSSTPSSVEVDDVQTPCASAGAAERLRLRRKDAAGHSQGQYVHYAGNQQRMQSGVNTQNPGFLNKKIPHSPKDEWQSVSMGIWNHFMKTRQMDDMYMKKMQLRQTVHSLLNRLFPGCGLRVVGSSVNGLGTNSSDVDMCLVLSTMEIDQQVEATELLRCAQSLLKQCSFVKRTDLITAKVPILKFTEKYNNIQVDLNINNTVGIANTHLLAAYSQLDWRVSPLVLVIKKWAQDCKINNAKEMTLSSYSLVLMIIHYLQCGCDPVVLPCLQKMSKHYDSGDHWKYLIPYGEHTNFRSKNMQSLGSLLCGFFHYYTEKFDFSKDVMSIRLGSKLPKAVAMNFKSSKNKRGHWKFICIEEPFNRTNTACAVYDQDSFNRILSAFRSTWLHLNDKKELASVLSS